MEISVGRAAVVTAAGVALFAAGVGLPAGACKRLPLAQASTTAPRSVETEKTTTLVLIWLVSFV
jgi:hypothetical protein